MTSNTTRRDFLKMAVATVGMPTIIPASALGRDGTVAPSNRIALGAIGIGPRGRYVLEAFLNHPDAQFVTVCDVQQANLRTAKLMVDRSYKNEDCGTTADMLAENTSRCPRRPSWSRRVSASGNFALVQIVRLMERVGELSLRVTVVSSFRGFYFLPFAFVTTMRGRRRRATHRRGARGRGATAFPIRDSRGRRSGRCAAPRAEAPWETRRRRAARR